MSEEENKGYDDFSSRCILCKEKEKIVKNESNVEMHELGCDKYIPICDVCFQKLPTIPPNYLKEVITEEEWVGDSQ